MAPLIASSGAGTPPLSEKASRKSRGPPFRFQPERDIASSLPAFLFLPSKKYLVLPFSFVSFSFFILFRFEKKNVGRSVPSEQKRRDGFRFLLFFFFSTFTYVRRGIRFGSEIRTRRRGDSRKYAADENNPPIDDCVAIGMLENIIGE